MGWQVDETEAVTLIDFPQMVSTAHPNAEELYARDIGCITSFFAKKLGYLPQHDAGAFSARPSFQVSNWPKHLLNTAFLDNGCPKQVHLFVSEKTSPACIKHLDAGLYFAEVPMTGVCAGYCSGCRGQL